MKILITGGAGFIGSAVIRKAVAAGHQIINVDCLTYAASLESLSSVIAPSLYHFEKVNIRDRGTISSILQKHQPDSIMHLAAESHVDRSIDDPGGFIQTNIVGTYTLLEAALNYFEGLKGEKKDHFRFHHVSTDEVYGDLSKNDLAFTEETPYKPSSPYSASKAAADHLVRAWRHTFDLPVLITNCSNNYGPFQFPEKLVPTVILKAIRGEPIPVYGSGENIRDWLYVDDHAEALLLALQKGKIGETYNIGGNNERTNLELVKTLCCIIDRQLDDGGNRENLIKFVPDRPGHDRRYAINASKIKDDLGWEPSISFNEGFQKTVDWYISNENKWTPLNGANGQGRLGLKTTHK
ncbi:dTDP-glucose 4,6-dehydratase [Litorimonas haliclonae]|uniref:dTDP-glucose 4,6-dehydratase n=1 Tax=Litorimonas haliclonae TaxID=2081977 RepID=UPI0039F13F8C